MIGEAFPPLVPGDGLNRYPDAAALRRRMAQVYGVEPEQLLPVRGATHGLELVLRAARLAGGRRIDGEMWGLDRLAAAYGFERQGKPAHVRIVASPEPVLGRALGAEEAQRLAAEAGLLVLDESAIEFAESSSLAPLTASVANLIVLRSLSLAYGLPGARCGAVIAAPALITRLEAVLEPHALPSPTLRAAEAVLSPSRALAVDARVRLVRGERERVRTALVAAGVDGRAGEAPSVFVASPLSAARERLKRYGIEVRDVGAGVVLPIGAPEANDRLLAAFGVASAQPPRRRGEAVRDTKETRIVATVDLDRSGDNAIRTGVGFFDHMLEQVAAHGGFSLRLACEGDLHIDPHHTIEDSTLAFGAALRQALGDKAGIGRYGFTAPMDEAEAALSLDLGGRPFAVFDGAFHVERIGDYPTALTPHVFRSLAESLGAAIHVRVTGDDDHHKTEVCFKALGRALRQAIRVEGAELPSTKGMIA